MSDPDEQAELDFCVFTILENSLEQQDLISDLTFLQGHKVFC